MHPNLDTSSTFVFAGLFEDPSTSVRAHWLVKDQLLAQWTRAGPELDPSWTRQDRVSPGPGSSSTVDELLSLFLLQVFGLVTFCLWHRRSLTNGRCPRGAELIEPCGYEPVEAAGAVLCASRRAVIELHNSPCLDSVQWARKILPGALIRSIQSVLALLIVTRALPGPTSQRYRWSPLFLIFFWPIFRESAGGTKGGSN